MGPPALHVGLIPVFGVAPGRSGLLLGPTPGRMDPTGPAGWEVLGGGVSTHSSPQLWAALGSAHMIQDPGASPKPPTLRPCRTRHFLVVLKENDLGRRLRMDVVLEVIIQFLGQHTYMRVYRRAWWELCVKQHPG